MKYKSFFKLISLSVFLLLPFSAWAHRVGEGKWCLMTTSVHYDCLYDDSGPCNDARKILTEYMKANPSSKVKTMKGEEGAQKIDPVCLPNSSRPSDLAKS